MILKKDLRNKRKRIRRHTRAIYKGSRKFRRDWKFRKEEMLQQLAMPMCRSIFPKLDISSLDIKEPTAMIMYLDFKYGSADTIS